MCDADRISESIRAVRVTLLIFAVVLQFQGTSDVERRNSETVSSNFGVTVAADIRRSNELTCLLISRDSQTPLTVAELVQRTGLSRPTVEAVMVSLTERGLLREVAPAATGREAGRPARRFAFEAEVAVVLSVEAAPRVLRFALSDLRGQILWQTVTEVPRDWGAARRLQAIIEEIRNCLTNAHIPHTKLKAVCVGVSGIVGHDGKIAKSYYVPDWNNVDIAGPLERALGCPVILENDIKLAAYGEHQQGGAQLVTDILYFQLGDSVSLASIIGGRIHQGMHRTAGELASLRGMKWSSNSRAGELSWKGGRSTREILTAAEGGDADALTEIQEFAADIAQWIATAALVLDPDVVLIGGEVGEREFFAPLIEREILRRMLVDSKPAVGQSRLGKDATLIGALCVAFSHHSEELFGIPGVPAPLISL